MKSTTTTFLLITRLSMVKLSMFLNSRNSPKKSALMMNLPRISMDSICRVASNKIQITKANTKSRANTISRMNIIIIKVAVDRTTSKAIAAKIINKLEDRTINKAVEITISKMTNISSSRLTLDMDMENSNSNNMANNRDKEVDIRGLQASLMFRIISNRMIKESSSLVNTPMSRVVLQDRVSRIITLFPRIKEMLEIRDMRL